MIEKAIIVAIWQEVWTSCETNGTALSLLLLEWYSTQLTMTLLYKTSNYMALTTRLWTGLDRIFSTDA